MDADARMLLDNMLDALDRLYDGESSAIDVQALAQATAAALPHHALAPVLSAAAHDLLSVVRAGLPRDERRAAALIATGALREQLAEVL